jgi:hypothetical protein
MYRGIGNSGVCMYTVGKVQTGVSDSIGRISCIDAQLQLKQYRQAQVTILEDQGNWAIGSRVFENF